MNIQKQTKINQLLQIWPQDVVATSAWLAAQNISSQLQAQYLKNGWIERVAYGCYKRTGDNIDWQGWLHAMQKQEKLQIHVGGLSAISMQGSGHYIRFKEKIQLFNIGKILSSNWIKHYNIQEDLELYQTIFIISKSGLAEYNHKSFSIIISSLERAILECLYLAPKFVDLIECYYIMESLTGLRPHVLQELLESCSSIRVKRLFFYFAEKANHAWLQYIDKKNIDFGKGKRSIVKNGCYNSKYQITIPKELDKL